MNASRIALRHTLPLRPSPALRPKRILQIRKQTTQGSPASATSSPPSSGNTSSILLAGVAGGAVALGGFYSWYHFSGTKTLVNSAHTTKHYLEELKNKAAESLPSPDRRNASQSLKYLRDATNSYAAIIPGAKGYIDSAFNDFDKVYDKHRDEVDKIISNAYSEMSEVVSKGSLDPETAQKVFDIARKYADKMQSLATDAATDVLDNHPELKEKLGGGLDQLKRLGDAYGSEAKKQVDQTVSEVKEIAKNGLNADTIEKIQKLVQDKTEQLKKMGDQAWEKGIKEAQQYLDKVPELKKLVNEKKEQLKQGNVTELFAKVKKAAESGDAEDVKEYVQETVDKASSSAGDSSGSMVSWAKMLPAGIGANFSKLQELAKKHGKEAEQIMKDTVEEVQQVVNKNMEKAQKLKDKASEDAKKNTKS